MRLKQLLIVVVPLALGLGAGPGQAGGNALALPYALDPDAEFETGCFGPCACPVLIRQGLKGSFELVFTGFDGLFDHYDVLGVHWSMPTGTTVATIDGQGTYRVGGEVAVEQELILDLSVDGQPAQRYDSGLVAGGGTFPALDVQVALHGFFCHDSVYVVKASPAVAGVPAAFTGGGLGARPNPFRTGTMISFQLDRARGVNLDVLDVSGRRVRTLAAGAWFGAGTHTMLWDGLGDDGRRAPAGLYFMRLRTGDTIVQRTLVRL